MKKKGLVNDDNVTMGNVGRLGNVCFYMRQGVQVARTIPFKVKNPRTPAQQRLRKRMGKVSKLAVQFKPTYSIGFAYACSGGATAYNAFISENMKRMVEDVATGEWNIEPSNIMCAVGPLPTVALEAEYISDGHKLRLKRMDSFVYDNGTEGVLTLYAPNVCITMNYKLGAPEYINGLEIELSNLVDVNNMYAYSFCVNNDLRRCSNSFMVKLN
ncbi:MAG: hypothetical protein ACRDDZ_10650 [Marinifilaceae bacterium]